MFWAWCSGWRGLYRYLAALGFLGVVIATASLGWACVPQPLVSVQPMASGPPGGQVTVNALAITGPAEIRWSAPDGPLLATAAGPSFSVPITIPDVPRGLYSLVVVERQPGGSLGSSGIVAFEVTAPGDTLSGESHSPAQPSGDAPKALDATTALVSAEPSPPATPGWLLAVAGFGLVALGVLGGLLLSRRRPPALALLDSERVDASTGQLRVQWSRKSGEVIIEPAQPCPLVDAAHRDADASPPSASAPTSADISTDLVSQLQFEQQTDLRGPEPPLPSMPAPSAVVATGTFYNIDQTGRGRASIYRHADDSYSLRLDDFFVAPSIGLQVRLSTLEAPRRTEEFRTAPSALVSHLDTNAGSMDVVLPPEVDPTFYRSVVIWCSPLQSAYAAATLLAEAS